MLQLLERQFGAALSEVARQQLDIAEQHPATVTATLNAINACAEWAPMPDFAKYDVVSSFLLLNFVFKVASFQTCLAKVYIKTLMQILMKVSEEFLLRSGTNVGVIDENEFEFAEYICESMVSLCTSNLQCVAGDATVLSLYLQQMLGYFQHFKLALHYQSLFFWLALMRDLMSKSEVVHSTRDGSAINAMDSGSGQVDSEKREILSFVNDNIYDAILDLCFQHTVKKEKVPP